MAGQVNVLLGDRCIAFTDAVPEVKNGRTMVPLRAALEAMLLATAVAIGVYTGLKMAAMMGGIAL